MFHASLQSNSMSSEDAVRTFLDQCQITPSSSVNRTNLESKIDTDNLNNYKDYLDKILLAYKIAKESSKSISSVMLILLFEWLSQYEAKSVWRGEHLASLNVTEVVHVDSKFCENSEVCSELSSAKYISVLCEALQLLIRENLKVIKDYNDNNKRKLSESDIVMGNSPQKRNLKDLKISPSSGRCSDETHKQDVDDIETDINLTSLIDKPTSNMSSRLLNVDRKSQENFISSTPQKEDNASDQNKKTTRFESSSDAIQIFGHKYDENVTYKFVCDLQVLKSQVVDKIQIFLKMYEGIQCDGYNVSILGSKNDVFWLSDCCWNLGVLLMDQTIKFSNDDLVRSSVEKKEYDLDRCMLTSELFEASQKLVDISMKQTHDSYSAINLNNRSADILNVNMREDDIEICAMSKDNTLMMQNAALCCILSISLRLDVDDIYHSLASDDYGGAVKDNLNTISTQLLQADKYVRQLLGCGILVKDMHITKLHVILILITMCRTHKSVNDIQQFIEDNMHIFLDMTTSELYKSISVCLGERGGSAPAARLIIKFGIQARMKDASPEYSVIGGLYRKLVNLSPNRQQVCS